MKLKYYVSSSALALIVAAAASGCGGGGGNKDGTTRGKAVGSNCTDIQGCVQTATGYQFPDGQGGTVTCTAGKCTVANANFDNGVAQGYAQGQSEGYASGKTDGYNQGKNDGYNSGKTDGYNQGYGEGVVSKPDYNNGYNAGKPTGYDAGFLAGKTDGLNQGYKDGYKDGDNDGYKQGAAENYDQGHADGYADNYNPGYDAGHADGAAQGYDSGYDTGYNDGHVAGYNTGYDDGYNDGYNAGYSDGGASDGYNVLGKTKDVDLQKASLQKKTVQARAKRIAGQFQMSLKAATQLTQLADKVQALTVSGKMTTEDRDALTQSVLKVAGITTEEVNKAIAGTVKGDKEAVDALMGKAAKNLGMPSSAGLRDRLLPALGIKL